MATFKDNSLHRFPTQGANVTVFSSNDPSQWAIEADWIEGELKQIGPEEYQVVGGRYAYQDYTYGSSRSDTVRYKEGTILRTKNYR